jgi:hypothetical protein
MVGFVDGWLAKRREVHWSRRWPFAVILGVLLGISALLGKGTLATDGLVSPCQMTVVNTDLLPVRDEPDASVQPKAEYNLKRGDQRGATNTVRNGYRQLSDGNWALDTYLQPLAPSRDKCAPEG